MIKADREVVLALAERLIAEKVLTGSDVTQVLDHTDLSVGPMRRRQGSQTLEDEHSPRTRYAALRSIAHSPGHPDWFPPSAGG